MGLWVARCLRNMESVLRTIDQTDARQAAPSPCAKLRGGTVNSLRTDVLRVHASIGATLVGFFVLAASSTALAQEKPRVVNVDCTQGETIARALTRGNESGPLLVLIRGTCNESVLIDRSDVTLRGESGFGGGIAGPDPVVSTVIITASRVAIEGLTVTGGRNGIEAVGAAGLAVRNATVQNTGRTGIVFISGASGLVDGCTIQFNPREGVTIAGAQGIVVNSVVSENRGGVVVIDGGSARIGFDNLLNSGGNTIRQNAANGISVAGGSSASIAMNQISGNGTNPAEPGRSGVSVIESVARIAGGNTISDNAAQGVATRSASVVIGDPAFGFPTVNTITGNGGGVSGFLGTSMVIRDAVISGNDGFGLVLSLRSNAQLFASTIENSRGDGIRVTLGSALFVSPPNTSVSGSAGWGLQCTDGESSVANTQLLTFSGNNVGGVSPGCTGF